MKEDGTFLKSIGNGQGSGPNQFDIPRFITRLPNGVLVVKDSSNGNHHRLQFVQEDGTFLGSHDEGPLSWWSDIAVLPDGSLVACNTYTDCLDFLT